MTNTTETGGGAGTPNRQEKGKPADEKTEHQVDEAVEDTFPASDAPSHGGTTKLGDDGKEVKPSVEPATRQPDKDPT
jgi:hypothetical protein